jgi:hypothetical protein
MSWQKEQSLEEFQAILDLDETDHCAATTIAHHYFGANLR